ncbi:MAG: homoprotocatechuate degradation operon regulator HpaR [Acidimicrobiales bacterium]
MAGLRSPGAEPAMRSFGLSLPMALLRARENAMRSFRPMLAEHDLTEQQWRVLRALTAADEPVEVSALADQTSLHAPSVSRILVKLESRSLISRQAVSHDQRRSAISLTEVGRAVVGTIAPDSEQIYNRIEKEFGSERLGNLLVELRDLAELQIDNPRSSEREAS